MLEEMDRQWEEDMEAMHEGTNLKGEKGRLV